MDVGHESGWGWVGVFFGWARVGETFFMGEWGWVGVGGGIFWVGGGGLRLVGVVIYFGWGWVEVYFFGWVGVSGGGHSF